MSAPLGQRFSSVFILALLGKNEDCPPAGQTEGPRREGVAVR